LAQAVVTRGPISVAVDATNWGPYKSGIFGSCSKLYRLNHGVLLVGVTNTTWKIKNSWNTWWGESGYIQLPADGGANSCGISQQASYPIK
jgi:cathepsin L